jgi:signal transduction histidine kinase
MMIAPIAAVEPIDEIAASRRRLVAGADRDRRAVRDALHAGPQQRVVQTVISLKLAQAALDSAGDPRLAELVGESLTHAQLALADLREVVHGILPATLDRLGLLEALVSLAATLELRVDLDVTVPRMPDDVEIAAYLVVARSLADAVADPAAPARRASVTAQLREGALDVVISHDGASLPPGPALDGLADRVAAGRGRLVVARDAGSPTVIRLCLPLTEDAAP